MFVKLLEKVQTPGGEYPAGEVIGLQDGLALKLIRAGQAERHDPNQEDEGSGGPVGDAPAGEPPGPFAGITPDTEGLTQDEVFILEEMALMVKEGKDLTVDKKPEVAALSNRLQVDVTAAERDALFGRITVEA